MAHTTQRAIQDPPLAQHILNVDDIDEALLWTSMTGPRTAHWWRWTDHLLDQRNRIQRTTTIEQGKPHDALHN